MSRKKASNSRKKQKSKNRAKIAAKGQSAKEAVKPSGRKDKIAAKHPNEETGEGLKIIITQAQLRTILPVDGRTSEWTVAGENETGEGHNKTLCSAPQTINDPWSAENPWTESTSESPQFQNCIPNENLHVAENPAMQCHDSSFEAEQPARTDVETNVDAPSPVILEPQVTNPQTTYSLLSPPSITDSVRGALGKRKRSLDDEGMVKANKVRCTNNHERCDSNPELLILTAIAPVQVESCSSAPSGVKSSEKTSHMPEKGVESVLDAHATSIDADIAITPHTPAVTETRVVRRPPSQAETQQSGSPDSGPPKDLSDQRQPPNQAVTEDGDASKLLKGNDTLANREVDIWQPCYNASRIWGYNSMLQTSDNRNNADYASVPVSNIQHTLNSQPGFGSSTRMQFFDASSIIAFSQGHTPEGTQFHLRSFRNSETKHTSGYFPLFDDRYNMNPWQASYSYDNFVLTGANLNPPLLGLNVDEGSTAENQKLDKLELAMTVQDSVGDEEGQPYNEEEESETFEYDPQWFSDVESDEAVTQIGGEIEDNAMAEYEDGDTDGAEDQDGYDDDDMCKEGHAVLACSREIRAQHAAEAQSLLTPPSTPPRGPAFDGVPSAAVEPCAKISELQALVMRVRVLESQLAVIQGETRDSYVRANVRRRPGKKNVKINALKEDIRKHTMTLLGLKTPKDELPCNPSPEEIAAFEDNNFGGPSQHNFRPDFYSTLKGTYWNQKIVKVFTDTFMATYLGNEEADAIAVEFGIHFQHLRARYKRQIEARPLSGDRRNSRRMRRGTLFRSRVKGCLRFIQLDHLLPWLDLLGVDGMSEDESDHEVGAKTGNRAFRVKNLLWRSKTLEFLAFLEMLDILFMSTKFAADGTPNPGNWPRVRIRDGTNPTYETKAVCGLPQNFYDIDFLSRLKAEKPLLFKKLDPQPPVDLTIDPRIIEWAKVYLPMLSTDEPQTVQYPPSHSTMTPRSLPEIQLLQPKGLDEMTRDDNGQRTAERLIREQNKAAARAALKKRMRRRGTVGTMGKDVG